ncbi:MAG: tRNA threonylcarbamoyladenosine dehydratase [Eubacterium sp.]|nr:tRNA threonylcarbamoyladenosine dehydratase [Eubacterium sp.]
MQQLKRSELLWGSEALEKIKNSTVAVFGLGGVGGNAAEAVARSGVGAIDLIDGDTVGITNLNRQLVALHSTLDKNKAEVMRERILDINPECKVRAFNLFFDRSTEDKFDFTDYDYVIDCIDTVTSKLRLVEICNEKGVPIISSMGTGNKLDASKLEVCDISQTTYDPLARVMRKELKKRGIYTLTVVYSCEKAVKPDEEEIKKLLEAEGSAKRTLPASSPFVPPAAGIMLASKVVCDLGGIACGKTAK